MADTLQITFRDMERSEAVESRIRAKAKDLERFHDHISSTHVTVEMPHRRHHQGTVFSVSVDIRVPGDELIVSRETERDHAHEDVYVAIRDAFDAAVRQLEDYARRQRGKTKRHEVPLHGKISQLLPLNGYGFIQTTEGLEVYFHEHAVTQGEFAKLRLGDEVRAVLAEGEGEHGPQASTVTLIGKHHLGR